MPDFCLDYVKSMLPDEDIYVYKSEGEIKILLRIDGRYIAEIINLRENIRLSFSPNSMTLNLAFLHAKIVDNVLI